MPSAQDPLPFHRTAMLPLSLAVIAIALALVFVLACGVSLGLLFPRVRKAAAIRPRG